MEIIQNCTLRKVEVAFDSNWNYEKYHTSWDQTYNTMLFLIGDGEVSPEYRFQSDLDNEKEKIEARLASAGSQKLKVFVSPKCFMPRNIIRQKYDIVRDPDRADILVMQNQVKMYTYDTYYTSMRLLVEYTNTVTKEKQYCYYVVMPDYHARIRMQSTNKNWDDVKIDVDKLVKRTMGLEGFVPTYTTVNWKDVSGNIVRYCEQDDVVNRFYSNNSNQIIICEKYLPMDMPTQFNIETMKSLYYCADKDVFEKAFVASNYTDYPLCAKMIYRKQKRSTSWFNYRAKINRKMLSVIDDMKLDEGYYKWSQEKISPEDYNLFINFLMDIANVKEKGFITRDMYEEFDRLDFIHFLPVGFAIKRPAKTVTEPVEVKEIWYE